MGSFFQASQGKWVNTMAVGNINRKVSALGLEENDRFTVEVIAVPELYTGSRVMTTEDILALKASGSLKQGAFLTTTLTVDDTAPVVEHISKDLLTGNLTITAQDNQYIAAIQVTDLSGTRIYGSAVPEATEPGQRTSTTIDLSDALIGETCMVMVADYADNVTAYELTYGGEGEDYTGRMFGFTSGYFRGPANRWVELDPQTVWYDIRDEVGEGMQTIANADRTFTAAEYVGGRIFAAGTDGCLYTTVHGEWAGYQKVGLLYRNHRCHCRYGAEFPGRLALCPGYPQYPVHSGSLDRTADEGRHAVCAAGKRMVQCAGVPHPGH